MRQRRYVLGPPRQGLRVRRPAHRRLRPGRPTAGCIRPYSQADHLARALLQVMGETLVLATEPMQPWADPADLARERAMTSEECLEQGIRLRSSPPGWRHRATSPMLPRTSIESAPRM